MLEEFKIDIERAVIKFPKFKEKILETYELTLSEIKQGSSVEHEIHACISSIEQLINI